MRSRYDRAPSHLAIKNTRATYHKVRAGVINRHWLGIRSDWHAEMLTGYTIMAVESTVSMAVKQACRQVDTCHRHT